MDDLGIPGNSAFSRQLALIEKLRKYGDNRFGGVLPLGGKASAGSRSDYPMSMHPAEQGSYDAMMNLMEAELEDLGKQPGGMSLETLMRRR